MDLTQLNGPELDLERRPTLFLVYTVHLDSQWRWTIRDTIREFIPATLRGNFELLAEHPERVLSFEGAFRYQLMEEYYPREFERLRELVAEGSWRPAGTMLDAPDVNCVAPESLLRQIHYAKRYFQTALGTTSQDLFLPDCFGFGHALPSIAAHCGLTGFSAQKFGNWGTPAELPFDVGMWLGPDGKGVVAAIRPEGYGEGLHEDLSRAERWQHRIARQAEISGLQVAFMYVGLGDRGGRLTEESLSWIARSVGGDGPIEVRQTASDALFRALTPAQKDRLPRHQGELLLPTHGTGCWTSQAAAKRWNRRCERMADVAERAATIAHWQGAMRYPEAQLREGWQRFLWHQMHDDLTGTSIPEAYSFTWNDQLIALNAFDTVTEDAIRALAHNLDTTGPGLPIAVFNPLARPRQDIVEIEVDWPGAPRAIEAVGPDGEHEPVQILRRKTDRLRLIFAPAVPALGVAVWRLQPARQTLPTTDVHASAGQLTNGLFCLTWNPYGQFTSLMEKTSGREVFSSPHTLALLPDRSARWPAWEIRYEDIQAASRNVGGRPVIEVVERGPVRTMVEIRHRIAGSRLTHRATLASGTAGSRIEFEVAASWRSKGKLLKAVFGFIGGGGRARYGLGCGTIERGNNSRAKYEVPAESWAAVPAAAPSTAVLTDGNYGWDKPGDDALRLSLLRSPRVVRKFRHQGVQDHGHHLLRYAITTVGGSGSIAAIEQEARRFSSPPVAFQVEPFAGSPERSSSFLRVGPGTVVRALKKADDRDEIVVRLQEAGGVAADNAEPELIVRRGRSRILDGTESPLDGESSVGTLGENLAPYELRTLGLELEPPPGPARFTAEQQLVLAFDQTATSRQGKPHRFAAGGRSFPAELWPNEIQCGAVTFRLGPADGPNVIACGGQRLTWSKPSSTLYLLAAVTGRRRRVRFDVDGRTAPVEIDRWDGIIGRWKGLRRGLKHQRWGHPDSGFLRTDTIGWVATHLHDSDGRDLPYEFGYLFRYQIALGCSDRTLHLPSDPAIRIFAATVCQPLDS